MAKQKIKEGISSRAQFRKHVGQKMEKKGIEDPFFHSGVREFNSRSTGILSIDLALGTRGFLKGRIAEIYGKESSGKTLLSLLAAAAAWRRYGEPSLFIDAEHTFDPTWFKTLGGDPDEGLDVFSDFIGAEDAWDVAVEGVATGLYAYIIVDSLAAMAPEGELELGTGESISLGAQAKLNKRGLRNCNARLHQTKTNILIINHIIEKPGIAFGNPEDTPGGRAVKHLASQRLEILQPRSKDIKEKSGEKIGHLVRGKVVKNKLAPPFREFEFDINYTEGADNVPALLEAATEVGIYENKKLYLDGGEDPTHEFEKVSDVKKALNEDMELLDAVWDKVLDLKTGTRKAAGE